jgi:hypothetical protein
MSSTNQGVDGARQFSIRQNILTSMKKLSMNSKKPSLFTTRRLQVCWFTLKASWLIPSKFSFCTPHICHCRKKSAHCRRNFQRTQKSLPCLQQGGYRYNWFTLQPACLYLPNLASALPAYAIAAKNLHPHKKHLNDLKKAFLVDNKETTCSHFSQPVYTFQI